MTDRKPAGVDWTKVIDHAVAVAKLDAKMIDAHGDEAIGGY